MSATHTGRVWGGWCATYLLPLESLSPFQILDKWMFLIPLYLWPPRCNRDDCTLSPFHLLLFVLEKVGNSAWAASRTQSHGLEGAQAAGTPPAWSRQSKTWHFRKLCGISAGLCPAANSGAASELPRTNSRFYHL